VQSWQPRHARNFACRLDKIVEAGAIKNGADAYESEIPDLMRALKRWASDRKILLKAKNHNLTQKQQLVLMREFHGRLTALVELYDENPQLRSLLTASEQKRASKGLTGTLLQSALDRIPRQVRRRFGLLGRLQNLVASYLIELEAVGVLPSRASAAKEASDQLSLGILLYLGFHRRLGDEPPTSDADPRVAFASAVINFVERDSVKLSAAHTCEGLKPCAVRRRLSAHFERAKLLSTPRVPNLDAERTARAAWVAKVVEELNRIPTVSEDEAQEFSLGIPVDPNMDPQEAVRRFVAGWKE